MKRGEPYVPEVKVVMLRNKTTREVAYGVTVGERLTGYRFDTRLDAEAFVERWEHRQAEQAQWVIE